MNYDFASREEILREVASNSVFGSQEIMSALDALNEDGLRARIGITVSVLPKEDSEEFFRNLEISLNSD